MNKKIELTIFLFIILALSSVPFASATETLYVSNPTENKSGHQHYGASVINYTNNGKRFAGNDEWLSTVTWQLKNDSLAESGTVVCDLYAIVGDEPVSLAEPLAVSNNSYALTNLQADSLINFTFSWSNNSFLQSGLYYGVILRTQSCSSVEMATSSTDDGVLMFADTNGDKYWSTGSGYPIYYIYTEDGVGATPAPTTAPSTADETTELINTFADYLIPLITFLLPALILGWLTHWQKWPILIGLAIGSGLTYLFLGTEYLWLVILVVIGIGASAYQSSRGPG